MPQCPDRITLHHQAETHDQGRGLQRRENVEPDRRGDDAKREAAEPGDQRGKERPSEKHKGEGV
jgi:hypothetical protein